MWVRIPFCFSPRVEGVLECAMEHNGTEVPETSEKKVMGVTYTIEGYMSIQEAPTRFCTNTLPS
jgi:hypothetical protein